MRRVSDRMEQERKRSEQFRTTNLCQKILRLIENEDNFANTEAHFQAMKTAIAEYSLREAQEAVLVTTEYKTMFARKEGLLIHCALNKRNPSFEVLQLLLDYDVGNKSVLVLDKCGRLPLHYACFKNAPIGIIRLLLEHDVTRRSVLVRDLFEKLPIHYVCQNNAPIEVIQLFLKHFKCSCILVGDKRGRLPIHYVCQNNAPLEVVQLLLDHDDTKKSISVEDKRGRLPIHFSCARNAPIKVIELLLEQDVDKKTIFEKDNYGRLPIHYACKNNAPIEVIQLLLNHDIERKTVLEKNKGQELPTDIAIDRNQSEGIIQCLLRASVANRLTQLGLERWKENIRSVINGVPPHDPNNFFTSQSTRRTLVRRVESLLLRYERMESLSLLELAVWKASCLKYCGDPAIQFHSIGEINGLAISDANFDAVAYKKRRLVMSGINQIIPNVLQFL